MLFRELRLSGLLSFGPDGVTLPMEPLNVFIGPNGSGKSNFLEAISLFRGVSRDFTEPIVRSGGLPEWRWKGPGAAGPADPRIRVRLEVPGVGPVEHEIAIGDRSGGVAVTEERIEPSELDSDAAGRRRYFRPPRTVMSARGLERTLSAGGETAAPGTDSAEGSRAGEAPTETDGVVEYPEDFRPRESLLRYAAPDHPVLWRLRERYAGIRLFRDWSFGPRAPVRVPTSAHGRSDFLDEGAGNLALVLSHLHGERKRRFLEAAGRLFEGIVDVVCPVTGGVVSLHLEENGGRSIPSSRISDGTLRYLSLLAILLHPNPPPVVCIEEPELGLHPDLLPTISDLLVEASEHTQLIVTTHSDILVDALTERPESIVVCEKHDGKTTMRRLGREELDKWLSDYRLGALWTSGELGGNRFGASYAP